VIPVAILFLRDPIEAEGVFHFLVGEVEADAFREVAFFGAEDVEDGIHAVDEFLVHDAEAGVIEEPVAAMAAGEDFVDHFSPGCL
jgi:hypothetical protein